jgi:hypothetical protein
MNGLWHKLNPFDIAAVIVTAAAWIVMLAHMILKRKP